MQLQIFLFDKKMCLEREKHKMLRSMYLQRKEMQKPNGSGTYFFFYFLFPDT